ncbi:MAG: Rid family hydrolase [Pseudomonadota bacterium]|nr:Rid family hydrolase [Pseudomonadota bacterium]
MSTSGGGRFEKIGSYVRAKRIGPFVFVAGTTAIEPSGKLHAPGDTYAQTIYVFDRITDALARVGTEIKHVVRTRAYLADMKEAGGFVRAHGEIFAGIEPVSTAVEAGLTTPGMMVEIEVDAIIHDVDGQITLEGT